MATKPLSEMTFEEFRVTYPPMMGGDETATDADTAAGPDTETPDQPAAEAAAPDAETSGTSGESDDDESPDAFTDVDPEQLPDDVRTRYQQMQADYTRKTQELAERRGELDEAASFIEDVLADEPNETQESVFLQLAERLGYDIDDDNLDDEDVADEDEDDEFRDPRVDALLAEREQQQQAQEAEQYEAQLDQLEESIETGLTGLAEKDGVKLTDKELDFLFSKVLSLPPGKDGNPDVKSAYAEFREVENQIKDRYVKSKKSTQAPAGPAGEDAVDFSDDEQRLAYTARRVEAAMRD